MSTKIKNEKIGLVIGIASFIVWVVVAKWVILSDGAGYDHVEHEWVMSTGQSWAMFLWTIGVIVGAFKVYGWIVKD